MSELVPYTFEGWQVRTVLIDGEVWFVLADVAKILGYRDAANAGRILRDRDRRTHRMSTPNGVTVTVVSEAGLYRLIMRSNQPKAEEFQDWVTDDLLPTLRKERTYSLEPQGKAPAELSPREMALLILQEADRADAAESKVAELEPKLEAVEAKSEEQRREIVKSRAPLNYLRTHVDARKDTTTFTTMAKQLGLRSGHQLYIYLEAIDMIWQRTQGRRRTSGGWEDIKQWLPRAGYEHCFKILDQPEAPPLHNGQKQTTLYVLPPGKVEIAEKLADRPIDTVLPPSNVTKLPKRGRKKPGGAA